MIFWVPGGPRLRRGLVRSLGERTDWETGDERDDLVRSLKKKKKKAPGGTYISEQAPNWVLHFRIVTLTVQIIIA
jgi:hypothetical protein